MIATSIPPTHVRPDIPPTIWMVGPLERPAVARFIAEIEHRVRVEELRPTIAAALDGAQALLFVIDHACSMQTLGVLLDHGATSVRQLPPEPHLSTRAGVRAWATTPTAGADGAAAAVARVERAVRDASGVCQDCGEPIGEPAPGFARFTLDLGCWKKRRAEGIARARAADERMLTQKEAA